VAFIYAGFGLAFSLARRAPLQGFVRRIQANPRAIWINQGSIDAKTLIVSVNAMIAISAGIGDLPSDCIGVP
jgi:hypothetical protein